MNQLSFHFAVMFLCTVLSCAERGKNTQEQQPTKSGEIPSNYHSMDTPQTGVPTTSTKVVPAGSKFAYNSRGLIESCGSPTNEECQAYACALEKIPSPAKGLKAACNAAGYKTFEKSGTCAALCAADVSAALRSKCNAAKDAIGELIKTIERSVDTTSCNKHSDCTAFETKFYPTCKPESRPLSNTAWEAYKAEYLYLVESIAQNCVDYGEACANVPSPPLPPIGPVHCLESRCSL